MTTTAAIQALHEKHVLTPWSVQGGLRAPVVTHGEGRHLVDSDGKRYLDLGAGLVAVNLGHGHPKVVKAIAEQAAKLSYAAPSLFHDGRAELAAKLSSLSPFEGEGARVFFTTGGAESNDDLVRIVRTLTGRQKVLVAYRSFHGATGQAINLTGEDRRWGGEGAASAGIVRFFAPYPYRSPFWATTPEEECERAIQHLERVLLHEDPKRVAALLIEPVVGSNGVIQYPDGYLARLRALTEKHGILLVFDEVMTGFGRLGATFGAVRFGVRPDLITFAKGVTSAYVPLGGVMVREGLAKHFDDKPLPCGHTYSGHPLGVAAALAALAAYEEEGLYARGKALEGLIEKRLAPLREHPLVGDVRGLGAFFAVELVKDKKTKEPLMPWHGPASPLFKQLYAELRARGVYTLGRFNVVMVSPPLTITEAELDEGVAGLTGALDALAKSV